MLNMNSLIKEWLNDAWPSTFIYNGCDAEDIIPEWNKSEIREDKEGYIKYIISYRDPITKLLFEIRIKIFTNYPAIEWVEYFKNEGSVDTPIIENILPFQWMWENESTNPPKIHYLHGTDYKENDFLPLTKELSNNLPIKLSGYEGRPSTETVPFINLQTDQNGLIYAIGWTGQWFTKLHKLNSYPANDTKIIIEAGMENTHLKLFPGEEIRTPSILLLFWSGDRIDSQNQFRHLIMDHFSPISPKPEETVPLSYPTWGGMSSQEHLERLTMIEKHNLDYDHYWIDAGWYIPNEELNYNELSGSWGKYVGSWNENSILYPNGIKEVSDKIHELGMKFILWFEPERARINTNLPKDFPQWFLSSPKNKQDLLFNLGNPEARQWMTQFISTRIKNNNIDCYRQDFNFDPLSYWQANDEPDRQGISEILHIMGLYKFWDDLREQNPGLLIDNCAGGGRRIELEMVKRSIPLWRSDLQCFQGFDPIGSQVQTDGLMNWIPYHAAGTQTTPNDTYNLRSVYGPGLDFHQFLDWKHFDEQKYSWQWHKQVLAEYRKIQPYFKGDYYLLSECSTSTKSWYVYQLNMPQQQSGVIIAFRRRESPYCEAIFLLNGINPKSNYIFEESIIQSDKEEKINISNQKISGKILHDSGISIHIDKKRESKVLFYQKVD